jgi:hypothetical protein
MMQNDWPFARALPLKAAAWSGPWSRAATCRASTERAVESHLRLASAKDYPLSRPISERKETWRGDGAKERSPPYQKREQLWLAKRIRSKDGTAFLTERIIDVKTNLKANKINTTLGELIATVSEFAFEYSADEKDAYDLARLVLVEMLKGASPESGIIDRHFPKNGLLH